jgi:hypothetical protein
MKKGEKRKEEKRRGLSTLCVVVANSGENGSRKDDNRF